MLKWIHLNALSDVHLCEYVCTGGNSCCTKEHPCSQWEGDCDNDDDCKDDLVCGSNNCPRKTGFEWDQYDDCCFQGNAYIDFQKKIVTPVKYYFFVKFYNNTYSRVF